MSVCLSVCLPVCLSACLSVCLSVCLPVCLSACLGVSVPVFVSLSLCVSVCHTFPSLTQADGTYEEEILWRRASAILTAHNPAVPLFLYLLCENG